MYEQDCHDIFFQPNQILFHVRGNFNGDAIDLIKWANNVAKDNNIDATVSERQVFHFNFAQSSDSSKSSEQTVRTYLPPTVAARQSVVAVREVNIPIFARIFNTIARIFKTAPTAKMPPPFSLVFADVDSASWPKFEVLKKEDKDYKEKMEEQEKAFSGLFDLIKRLDDNRKHAPVKVDVVSPNWLMSGGASTPGGTGGPGGKPSPVELNDVGTRNFNLASVFPSLATDLQSTVGRDVVVAILDTSYSLERLEQIKIDWPHNDLVQKLLGTSGALRNTVGALNVYPDTIAENYLPDSEIDGHDYDMNDHGLYALSIITSLAPQAELHLYQVLNSHGLGDLLSISRALKDIVLRFNGRQVIVNMSLTMNLPLEEEHCNPLDKYKIGAEILNTRPKPLWFWDLVHLICRILQWILGWIFPGLVLRCRWSWLDRQAIPLESISDLLYVLGSNIIAAAGNNGKPGNRPSALYPAAFDSVLGVGALSRGSTWSPTNPLAPASYSNLADTPTTQGVAVFGGEKGKKNGVMGVYVGDFPEVSPGVRPPNTTGLAWWCGTSFATPIISGLAANLIITGRAANPHDAINIILNTARQFGSTSAVESIMPVEQT